MRSRSERLAPTPPDTTSRSGPVASSAASAIEPSTSTAAAEQRVFTHAVNGMQLCVSAGDEQRDKREWRTREREQWREQMTFEMMHADDGFSEREAKTIGHAGADEQRARKTRTLRVRDAIQVREPATGFAGHAL